MCKEDVGMGISDVELSMKAFIITIIIHNVQRLRSEEPNNVSYQGFQEWIGKWINEALM